MRYLDSKQKSKWFHSIHLFFRCYASLSDGENDFIALEDLTSDGYETTDRENGLDFNQCKQIMTLIGKFHALSLAFRDQEPSEFEKMVDCIEVILFVQN